MSSADVDAVWQRIFAQSAMLSERLAAYRVTGAGTTPAPDASVIEAWSRVALQSNDEQFQRRLEFLGLTLDDLPQCLAEPDVAGEPLPRWCELLRDSAFAPVTDSLVIGWLDLAPEALPELVHRLVGTAYNDLISQHQELRAPECELLRVDLITHLQHSLAALTQTCFAIDHSDAQLALPDAESWNSWVDEQVSDGLVGFWMRYPVLARLVGTTMALWVERSSELLHRAAVDIDAINKRFGCTLSRLHRVELGLSDAHNGHASVTDCTFVDDEGAHVHLIYKPKDISTEAAFAKLCSWLNEQGSDLGEPLRCLPMSGYGWVQKATVEPARSAAEVDRFFQRCGSLTALLFALGGVDLHTENVVAHGDRPLVIDAETVLHPGLLPEGQAIGTNEVHGMKYGQQFSVLDTHILPRWTRVGDKVVDPSALGTADRAAQPQRPHLTWQHAGTSNAHLVVTHEPGLQRNSDLVDASGAIARASDHSESLLTGFDSAWSLLASLRGDGDASELFSDGGPLGEFASAPIRAVIRRTSMYAQLLQESMTPILLTDGLQRSIHLERLARYILTRRDSSESLALIEYERDQLEIGDIPIFTAAGSSHELTVGVGRRAMRFQESAIERAASRIEGMTSIELKRQHRYVRASLAVAEPDVRLRELLRRPQIPKATHGSSGSEARSHGNGDVRVVACRILLDQIAAAVDCSTESANIVGLTALTSAQWGIGPLDTGLFDGSLGLATAVFAAAQTMGDPEVDELAIALLRPAIADSVSRVNRLAQIRGLGGQNGLGGRLFGLAACHQLTVGREPHALIEQGLTDLVGKLTPELLNQRQPIDLFPGRVGFLAGLLATESAGVTIAHSVIERTVQTTCDALVEYQRSTPRAERGIGYPYGESGVAAILAELGARNLWDEALLEEMIRECLMSESEKFNPQTDDWPEMSDRSTHPFLGGPGWCNGLPGMALSRVEIRYAWPTLDLDLIDRDLRSAAPGLTRSALVGDMLCCGNAGRAEVLRRLATVAADGNRIDGVDSPGLYAEYATTISHLATRTVENRLRLGVPRNSPLTSFGLYFGLGGVLYALVAAAPDRDLPSLLSWRLG